MCVIHSVYILKDGLPLVSQQCSPKAPQFDVDDTRMTGLLAAMNTFCAELGGGIGEMRALQTSNNLQFSFMRSEQLDLDLLFIVCHEATLNPDTARRTLARVASKFMKKFWSLPEFKGQVDVFADFSRRLPKLVSEVVTGDQSSTNLSIAKLPVLPPLPDIPRASLVFG
ncbi:MAG: hypothetical protein RBG13Loki_3880 [Promethearchaeota archaeon CR_4]|nr:MAG: hypothetical protein RBG13Loki_3880 [Candidatus Lokiarchaeota archaeon CR_4]